MALPLYFLVRQTTVLTALPAIVSSALPNTIPSALPVVSTTPFICGSETRNVSGDRHTLVPTDNHVFCGHLATGLHGWIEHHASDSESIVKAENHSISQTLSEMQETCAEHFLQARKNDTL